MISKGWFALGFLPFLVLVVGCGSVTSNTPATVSGTVTYKEMPVTGGTVTFYPKEGGAYPTGLDLEGRYTISVPTGEFTVTVETESINPKRKAVAYEGKKGTVGSVPEGVGDFTGEYVPIPHKYADKSTSGLTITLSAGNQTKDFPLTD
jgi:hypothetical protein